MVSDHDELGRLAERLDDSREAFNVGFVERCIEALLFAAARAQLVAEVIVPALQAGQWRRVERALAGVAVRVSITGINAWTEAGATLASTRSSGPHAVSG